MASSAAAPILSRLILTMLTTGFPLSRVDISGRWQAGMYPDSSPAAAVTVATLRNSHREILR